MEKEKVSIGEHITIGELTLVPILRTAVVCLSGRRGITGFGTKEVTGIVVVSPTGNHAISISGEEVPLEEFATTIPQIDELLHS